MAGSTGQGSLSYAPRPIPANGPPFPVNSANNGLSIDPITGKIVFGQSVGAVGDPAQLLNSREIEQNFFNIEFKNTGNQKFIDLSPGNISMFDLTGTGNGSIGINAGSDHADIGMTGFSVTPGQTATTLSFANQAFPGSSQYAIEHDDLNVLNTSAPVNPPVGTLLFPNANFKIGPMVSTDSGYKFQVSATNAPLAQFTDLIGNQFLKIDPVTGSYQLGDIDGSSNNTFIDIDDSLSTINLNAANSIFSSAVFAPGIPARTGISTVILKDNGTDQLTDIQGASGTILPLFTSITVVDGIITVIV